MKVIDLRNKLKKHPTRRYSVVDLYSKDMLVLHCSDADWTIDQLVDYSINPNHVSKKGAPESFYHIVGLKDGSINQCVDLDKVTWHAGKYNPRSISYCLMYRATNKEKGKPNYKPDPKMVDKFIKYAVSLLLHIKTIEPKNIKGHRELETTGWIWKINKNTGKARKSRLKWCPGQFVDMDIIRWKVTRRLQLRLKVDGYYDGGIDNIWGPKSQAALRAWKPTKRKPRLPR